MHIWSSIVKKRMLYSRLLIAIWMGVCAIAMRAEDTSQMHTAMVHWYEDKFSVRLGAGLATYPYESSDMIQPAPAPTFMAGIDYAVYQNRGALWIRYHRVFVHNRRYGVEVLQHLVTSGLRWYVVRHRDIAQFDVHAGFLYNLPVLTWDVGGTVGVNVSQSIIAEATLRYVFTIPLVLPAYRWPLVYSVGVALRL